MHCRERKGFQDHKKTISRHETFQNCSISKGKEKGVIQEMKKLKLLDPGFSTSRKMWVIPALYPANAVSLGALEGSSLGKVFTEIENCFILNSRSIGGYFRRKSSAEAVFHLFPYFLYISSLVRIPKNHVEGARTSYDSCLPTSKERESSKGTQ